MSGWDTFAQVSGAQQAHWWAFHLERIYQSRRHSPKRRTQ